MTESEHSLAALLGALGYKKTFVETYISTHGPSAFDRYVTNSNRTNLPFSLVVAGVTKDVADLKAFRDAAEKASRPFVMPE